MTRYTATLRIKIEGPVLTTGLEAAAFGIDDSHLVGAYGTAKDKYILPESLVRGNIVHVLREMREAMTHAGSPKLAEVEKVIGWLGTKSGDVNGPLPIGGLDPQRRAIRFDDLVLKDSREGRNITRIKLDSDTGSVERGSLQIVASPLDIGEDGTFEGGITCDLSKADADIALKWIKLALDFVPAIGALKGAGFGRISGPAILDEPRPVQPAAPAPGSKLAGTTPHRYARFALAFDRPFLVASEAISGNLFKGAIDVPGAVIKGALADEMRRRGLLPRLDAVLDKIVFRHAKPAKEDDLRRPRVVPRSLYSASEGIGDSKVMTLCDALVSAPATAGGNGLYVEFQPDWKDDAWKLAAPLCGPVFEPHYDVRTRTAINADGTADDSKLFTRMAVIPGDYVWIGEIEQAGVADPDFETTMAVLSEGLHGLGKTRANATVCWIEPKPRGAKKLKTEGGKEIWRLVLETDALLHGQNDPQKPIDEHYRAYFAEAIAARGGPSLCSAGIELEFYASQRWIGGYQARRFPHYPDSYHPQLLTCAGSVFKLTLPTGCGAAMSNLACLGLPLPESVGKGKTLQYERSAFNPENGYGEVTIEARALTDPVEEA